MLNGGECPLINIELEIGNNPRRLAALLVDEVEQDLFLARLGVLSLNPRRYLLRCKLVDAERAGCSLTIKTFCRLVIEIRVIHLSS